MNLLKLLPKKLRVSYERNILNSGIKSPKRYISKAFIFGLIVSLFLSTLLYFFRINPIISFFLIFFIFETIVYFRVSLKATKKIRKMESLFPDFIQLMSSNLRAGMTVDRAFLTAARPELKPLDEEILKTGREIATGEEIITAFNNMAKRINSERVSKVIALIISGLRAGGNISTLLETTASDMREKEFLEKRVASNVLMYVIFIFVSVGIGAPILFALSSILVGIIIRLTSQLPSIQLTQMNLPFVLSNIVGLTPRFVVYFALIFLIVSVVISSLVMGLVNKGDEKYGLRYVLPLIALSLGIFFTIRIFLSKFLAESFAIVS